MSELLKVGDRVRFVGDRYGEDYLGSEGVVQQDQYYPGHVFVVSPHDVGFNWWLGPGWEIEKIEEGAPISDPDPEYGEGWTPVIEEATE